MAWLTKTLSAVLVLTFSTAVDGIHACFAPGKCVVDAIGFINFNYCSFADEDVPDLIECLDTTGRSNILMMSMNKNVLTTIPPDLLHSMDSLTFFQIKDNPITSLDAATFQPVAATLQTVILKGTGLITVPAGLFDNLASLVELNLESNAIETLPSNIFADLESLETLNLGSNALETLPSNIFADLESLDTLKLTRNLLSGLPVDAFAGLSAVKDVSLDFNALTTLPAGIFEDLGSGGLQSLQLDGNDKLQCIPTVTVSGGGLPNTRGMCRCSPRIAVVPCGMEALCTEGAVGHSCVACPEGTTMCGDPHMQGLRGQTIDWSGVDGGWYCLVTDDDLKLQINVRLTAPLPESFPDRQLITGLSVVSEGHSLVIEVTNPYTVDTDGCRRGISPCLADGGLRAVVDGEEVDDLLRFSRNEYVADGIAVSASNLPVECRQFGGDKIWTRMYQEMLQGQRQLHVEDNFEDWILRFDHMAASDWCTQYIEQHDLADLQSNHAIFKIETSAVTVRLNVGTNYQGNGDLDWDGRVLPDLEFWQMDVGLQGLSLESESMSGILGETARPVLDTDGHKVMKGYEALRGTVEDYRVSGSLGTDFDLLKQP